MIDARNARDVLDVVGDIADDDTQATYGDDGFVKVVVDPASKQLLEGATLDYKDGLYWVVILAPLDPELPATVPVEDEIFEASWAQLTPLAVGGGCPWRAAGRVSGGASSL